MLARSLRGCLAVAACCILCDCSVFHKQDSTLTRIEAPAAAAPAISTPPSPQQAPPRADTSDTSWVRRTITEEELWRISEKDPDLSPVVCRQILARLNAKAHYYISEDIRRGVALKVPNNFSAYKQWSPLPGNLPQLRNIPKFILVAKDIPFLGWYENGRLMGDTMACIGKDGQATVPGLYRILEKDADHISRSYTNSFGRQAWMPWAMRLYEAVWIHAGDITGAQCSHGCVTLPLKPAEDLFHWADLATAVLVVDSLEDLERELKKNAAMLPVPPVTSSGRSRG
ncbi:MAG: L,D-transpeptidase [Syntrophobacteraceae bacterium]|nr:L,D-transpeptidase [Desulfobacteraceae bacterium]